ncbi:hypothetical protein HHK36_004468 [Tetracentron sinense]|uniref:BHLH domain-containing protein n=1 Tax=Tetracentron sinense TaxID=13715 RepID=A0A834ZUY9_TETSI|nr:hypothetical protein HHK36_004468 [Tetracentron sinense]
MESSQTSSETPMKQTKSDSRNSCTSEDISTSETTSPAHILSGNSNFPKNSQQFHGNVAGSVKPKDEEVSSGNMTIPSDTLIYQDSYMKQNYSAKDGQRFKRNGSTIRPPSYNEDHIKAERKRREKLSQRFIALSALVPGLKKMDKDSVLEDTVKYLKQLQEQVKTLEEQTMKKTVESVIFVKKSELSDDDDDTSSSDENFDGCIEEQLPEIEARISDRNVLIRVHCKKRKGVLVKALSETEKLHLLVTNSSAMPFGNSALDITIIAQMDVEFCMTVDDLLRSLRSAFGQFM